MAKKIAVITAPNVIMTGKDISFKFMFASGAPRKMYMDLGSTYGSLRLVDYECQDMEPVKDESKSEEDHLWEVFLGSGSEQVFSACLPEISPKDPGLKKILTEMPDCVLLMRRDIFDRVKQVCDELGISVEAFHCEEALAAS